MKYKLRALPRLAALFIENPTAFRTNLKTPFNRVWLLERAGILPPGSTAAWRPKKGGDRP